MTGKSLWQISVTTSLEAEEAVTELMARVFNRPAAVYTNEETKITVASVYCERRSEWTAVKKAALAKGLALIQESGLKSGAGTFSATKVAREDWAESWKRHFKAIEIGPRLLVKPGWIRRRPRKGQAVVVLDPGLSFGTGNHPTTAFCLRALADFSQPGTRQTFLDIGTGSGILAIAAAKLGYSQILAMDFDAEAVRVAKENARRNQVRVKIERGDITKLPLRSRVKYEFVAANLISNLLVAQKQRIINRMAEGGVLALAGILDKEFAQVQRAYEGAGLRLVKSRTEGEWRSGLFLRGELSANTDAAAH